MGSSYRLVGNLYYKKMIDSAEVQAFITLYSLSRGFSGMAKEGGAKIPPPSFAPEKRVVERYERSGGIR